MLVEVLRIALILLNASPVAHPHCVLEGPRIHSIACAWDDEGQRALHFMVGVWLLVCSVVEYKTLVLRGDMETAAAVLETIPKASCPAELAQCCTPFVDHNRKIFPSPQ